MQIKPTRTSECFFALEPRPLTHCFYEDSRQQHSCQAGDRAGMPWIKAKWSTGLVYLCIYIYLYCMYIYIYIYSVYIYIGKQLFNQSIYIYYISWIYDFLLWSIHFKVAHMRGDFIRKIVIARKWLPATWRAVEFCRWTTWISCSITRRGCWCSVPKPSWIRHDEAKYEMWAILIQIHPCPVGVRT